MLKIRRLYKEAFPRCERKPFGIIKAMARKGKTDLWCFEDEGGFAGLCATINGPDVILIDYLAVARKRRGKGVGTRMLRALLEHYADHGVFLEIEEPDENAENSTERVRRREFYLRLGFEPMNTFVNLFGVNMELLGVNCKLDFDEYRDFYLNNYGRFAYDHITPRK
jgi:GNAT superfamily N-acetyltransferase